ncbi:unnamed protein product [Strongylus vulgaris]|uniref:Peptidase C1A papain C-terminal domain-containing protein n=1 Tax=Strongylus vulgaris TaxID=40348 RepID=A0A3P7IZC3_STRVU|nr:unnamed protein product [Strongylus vulgaris]
MLLQCLITLGSKAYCVEKDEEEIKKEIFKNGPVQAAFIAYEDFSLYKGGIYKHEGGEEKGGHAVKLLGWGVENGTKFWIGANSWSKDWGENGGYFRFLRGENHCEIEEYINAGLLKVD